MNDGTSNDEQTTDADRGEADSHAEQKQAAESQTQNERNPLAMSDEDILAMDGPENYPDQPAESAADTSSDDRDGAVQEPTDESTDATDSDEQASDSAADDEAQDRSSAEQRETQSSDTQGEKSSRKKSSSDAPERDIAAEHAKLFAPLKAGGQTLEIKSVDEAISLMQKGADYHRKTEAIAPHMRTIKTLEQAKIGFNDLNHLIALHNKDPQAINKLISDAQIDPLDIDGSEEANKDYKPKDYSVSADSVALDETLEALKTTPTYNQLIDVVGNQWDDSSRDVLAASPTILSVINEQIGNGIYPIIATEMVRQRALGNLQGLNDVAAYQSVGQQIHEQGGFAHLNLGGAQTQETSDNNASQASETVRPRSEGSDPNLNARRRAAGSTRAAAKPSKQVSNQNPLALSDDAFEKQFSESLQ